MVELGDEVTMPNGLTAKVVGWQRMLGQNTEWCIRWWDDDGPTEYWVNQKELEVWKEEMGSCV